MAGLLASVGWVGAVFGLTSGLVVPQCDLITSVVNYAVVADASTVAVAEESSTIVVKEDSSDSAENFF